MWNAHIGPAARRLLEEMAKVSSRAATRYLQRTFRGGGAQATNEALERMAQRGYTPKASPLGSPIARTRSGSEGAYTPVVGQHGAGNIVSGRKINHGIEQFDPATGAARGVPLDMQQQRMQLWGGQAGRPAVSVGPDLRLPQVYAASSNPRTGAQHYAVEHIDGVVWGDAQRLKGSPGLTPAQQRMAQQFDPGPAYSRQVATPQGPRNLVDLHQENVMFPRTGSQAVVVDPTFMTGGDPRRLSSGQVRWNNAHMQRLELPKKPRQAKKQRGSKATPPMQDAAQGTPASPMQPAPQAPAWPSTQPSPSVGQPTGGGRFIPWVAGGGVAAGTAAAAYSFARAPARARPEAPQTL